MDDADVRQRRLGQDTGDVAGRELALQRLDVVPLDHPRRLLEWNRRSDIAFTGDHRPTVERGERLVDGAVVAPVEDEDLRPCRELPREPDREPIRIRGGERELPARQSEATSELFADPEGILTGQHERDTTCGLLGHRPHGWCRGVSGHRRCVAEAEVHVLVAVHVTETSAVGLGGEHGEAACPPDHPRHRHAREQRTLGPRGELSRTWVLAREAVELA
jgi:hypothetical protein